MAPAPLPPHERQWRHPSELAPTSRDIDVTTNGRGLIVATGAAAAMLVAVMVVALNPPRSSAPTAISATTLPSVVVRVQNPARDDAPKDATPGIVRIAGNAVSRGEGLALTGAPNAVSAAHLADEYALADDLPDDDERIMLLTSTATFVMLWGEIDQISYAPDDTLVITHSRELVAVFVDGDLRLLVR